MVELGMTKYCLWLVSITPSQCSATCINHFFSVKSPTKLLCVCIYIYIGNDNISGGCGPCNKPRCSWCSRINKTSTFTGTQNCQVYHIFHTMDCQSTWVIYVIECRICKLQYVGKSETGFNLRLNNHRNHIKSKVSSCELTEHFLQNTRTHNFDNDVVITIIEQIKRSDMLIERKKELLRRRERFWQRKLNTLQPNGLNKRIG